MAAEDVKEAQGGGTMEATGHVEQEGSTKRKKGSYCREYIVCFHMTSRRPFVSQNNETAAMFVSQTSPVGVELFSHVNAFFCSNKFA